MLTKLSQFNYCCKLLDIVVDDENDLSETILKRQYRKFCLLYHPDKHNMESSKFVEISNAYEFLGKYMGYIDDDDYNDDDHNNETDYIFDSNIQRIGNYIVHHSILLLSNEHVISFVDSMDENCHFKKNFKLLTLFMERS